MTQGSSHVGGGARSYFAATMALIALSGCRYVLGITDRSEGAVVVADSGPGADAETTADPAEPDCKGTACRARSCREPLDGGGKGNDFSCGPDGGDDCCATIVMDGGAFYPNNLNKVDGGTDGDGGGPVVVAPFALDKYEVTVARYREFFGRGLGTQEFPPRPNAGAIETVVTSGWDEDWNSGLEKNKLQLESSLSVSSGDGGGFWSALDGRFPMGGMTWLEAFAFCIWDGGRLPTEIEWSFAASGGDEQRLFPWSNPPSSTLLDEEHATYCPQWDERKVPRQGSEPGCNAEPSINLVGALPAGVGRFGHFDLAGNQAEWVFDYYVARPIFPSGQYANFAPNPIGRVLRGGSWRYPEQLLRNDNAARDYASQRQRVRTAGMRCARDVTGR